MKIKGFLSQMTFLYYDDLAAAAVFYEEVLGMETVVDQGFAKVFRTAGSAFLGIVDGRRGFHPTQKKNALVVSFTVDDLSSWYETLLKNDVKIVKEPEEHELAPLRSFFFEDPGGYTLEIQQFLNPEHQQIFNNP